MILDIVKYPNPALRAKGRRVAEITGEIRDLADRMIETMRNANGVGLAAQQVGVPIQLTVIDVAKIEDRPSTMSVGGKLVALEDWMPLALLNPQLELGKVRELGPEGCLSFPEINAEIERAIAVKAKATLIDGRDIEFEATGLLSRALQHETDHLHGKLFIDYFNLISKLASKDTLTAFENDFKRAQERGDYPPKKEILRQLRALEEEFAKQKPAEAVVI